MRYLLLALLILGIFLHADEIETPEPSADQIYAQELKEIEDAERQEMQNSESKATLDEEAVTDDEIVPNEVTEPEAEAEREVVEEEPAEGNTTEE